MIKPEAYTTLEHTVAEFVTIAEDAKLSQLVSDHGWSVKDVIAHVVSWQEYYARVTGALVKGDVPDLFKGSLGETNEQGVKQYRKFSRKQLLDKLNQATKSLIRNLKQLKVKEIPYRRGSRDYSPEEYIDVISSHIQSHTDQIQAAK